MTFNDTATKAELGPGDLAIVARSDSTLELIGNTRDSERIGENVIVLAMFFKALQDDESLRERFVNMWLESGQNLNFIH